MANIRQTAEDKKYRARQDLRAIQEAAAVQANKPRLAAAQKEAKSQIAALVSVAKKK